VIHIFSSKYEKLFQPSDPNIVSKVVNSVRLTFLPQCLLVQKPLKYVWIANLDVCFCSDITIVIQFCQFMTFWLCNSTFFDCGLSIFRSVIFCFNTFSLCPFSFPISAVQVDLSSAYRSLIVFSLILYAESTSFRPHG